VNGIEAELKKAIGSTAIEEAARENAEGSFDQGFSLRTRAADKQRIAIVSVIKAFLKDLALLCHIFIVVEPIIQYGLPYE
jgi:hypothetical protein